MKVIVADAGPLIGISRIGYLPLLQTLYHELLIPGKVREELKLSSAKPGSQTVLKAVQDGWIRCVPVNDSKKVMTLGRVIDAGEAEAIQLALEQCADLLLIDDKKGRKVAQKYGISISGIGGVLLAAKRKGLLPQVSPVLDALTLSGYRLSSTLYNQVIQLAGE